MPVGPGKTIPITRMGAVPIQTIGQAPNINQPLKGLGQPKYFYFQIKHHEYDTS